MCFFILLLKKPHMQWNTEQKSLEPRWKRGDGEREIKAATKNLSLLVMLDEMFGPVAALGVLSWQPLPVLQDKGGKMSPGSNADPLSSTRGVRVFTGV